jgi:hypothetical protein
MRIVSHRTILIERQAGGFVEALTLRRPKGESNHAQKGPDHQEYAHYSERYP